MMVKTAMARRRLDQRQGLQSGGCLSDAGEKIMRNYTRAVAVGAKRVKRFEVVLRRKG